MFDSNEKEYLRKLVEKALKDLKEDEKEAAFTDVTPAFVKGEAEYEEFIKKIIEKLK